MGIYYEYGSMAPKKKTKMTKSTQKNNVLGGVGWGGGSGWQTDGLYVGM